MRSATPVTTAVALALVGAVGCDRVDPHAVLAVPVVPSLTDPVTPWGADPMQAPVRRDARFDAAVQILRDEMTRNRGAGVSIAVLEQGVLTWAEGIGSSDPFDTTDSHPLNAETAFQIGGITQQFTAALVLEQAEAGLLSTDDRLDEALPDLSLAYDPAWTADVRIGDLLANQSGVYDYIVWDGPDADADLADWHYGFFSDSVWTLNPPGLFYNPSHPNATLAGLVVEAGDPDGRYFADILAEDLFEPLGMVHSYGRKADAEASGAFALSTGIGSEDAFGYTDIPMAEVPDPAYARPSELAWSTPTDLCTWGRFLLHGPLGSSGDGTVLDDAVRDAITQYRGSTLQYEEHLGYGYGVELYDEYPLSDGFHPLRVWRSTGSTQSFSGELLILPDHDVVIALLSNGYHDTFDGTLEAILRAVVDPFPAVSGYAGPGFDPGALDDHVGVYVDAANIGPFAVVRGGAYGLQIVMPGLEAEGYLVDADLVPESTDRWTVTIENAPFDLTFIRDATGRPTWVRNHLFVGTRSDLPLDGSEVPALGSGIGDRLGL
jgi:CubicO group peptidase (beta-lactamase class C family)